MSSNYKFKNEEQPYFVSFAVVHWIDLFIRNEYKQIILESIKYCQEKKGLCLYGWCIMTSHLHLIIGTQKDPMENILRDLKAFTSHSLRSAIAENSHESRKEWMIWMMERAGKKNKHNKGWQLWQQDNHPIELWDNYMLDQKLNYLHNNPVEAGFVIHPEHYVYSSARDYAGEKGLLNIIKIE